MSELVGIAPAAGLLGDTTARDYSAKLRQFNRFAERELRRLIESLSLSQGQRILDAGCGTGEALLWLQEAVGEQGSVTGIDLAAAHVEAAGVTAPRAKVQQGDLLALTIPDASFDLIWCANTINHMHDPLSALKRLQSTLRAGGRIALGQSSFLPDMYFAWDARLERVANEGVRQYYRDRYSLDERDLASVRRLVGLLHDAGFADTGVRTVVIERVSPLDAASETYLRETIFRDTWGERLRPYLLPDDYLALRKLCDPALESYALRRPDFHFIQTFTLAVGQAV